MASVAESLAHVDTFFSADSIEWCPFPGFEDIFICGTYQVLEPASASASASTVRTESADPGAGTPHPEVDDSLEQSGDDNEDGDGDGGTESRGDAVKAQTRRTGRLLVYQLIAAHTSDPSVKEVQRIESNAILDTKWFPNVSYPYPTLAVADAKGQIVIYALTPQKQLDHIQTVQVGEPTTLCLSLDIPDRLKPGTKPRIAVSQSNGSIAIPGIDEEGTWGVEKCWHAHDFEPWCVCWDNWERNCLWSGGDDLKLKKWDTRDTSAPVFVNKRFDAGITTITSSPHTPHLLIVGSYDSILRLYDTRRPTQALYETDVGGGVWRAGVHPDPRRAGEVLVAAMHGGFKVVHFDLKMDADADDDDNAGSIKVTSGRIIRTFDAHTSLAYGADWSRLSPDEQGQSLIATCSFYDHAMHLWRG